MVEDLQLVNKYGAPLPYDRNFRGPLWRRHSCTDVPCLLIFVAFLVGWGVIAQYAFTQGDLNKLMVPTDSLNRKCGIDSQVLGKKYLFFFSLNECLDPLVPITGCPTPQVCVESCPTQNFDWNIMKDSLPFEELKRRLICVSDEDKVDMQSMTKAIANKRCAESYIKSTEFLNRCMWELSDETCTFIMKFRRKQRDLSGVNQTSLTVDFPEDVKYAALLKSMALTVPSAEQNQGEKVFNCRKSSARTETVLKEKMRQTDTRLAKLVGNMVAHFYNGTGSHDAQRIGESIVEDIVNSWFVVLMALVCTLLASLVFIALMRWLAGPILWFSVLGVHVGLIFGIYHSIRKYIFWRDNPTVPIHAPNAHSIVKNILQESSTWLYLSIFLCASFVIIFLLVIVLRKRINIAIALIKEGSKAVSCIISTVFFPIFSWVLFIIIIVYTIAVGLHLGSIGTNSFRMIRQVDGSGSVSNENCICEGPAQGYQVGAKCDPATFQQHCYNPGGLAGIFRQAQRTPCMQTSCSFLEIEHPRLVTWYIVYNVFAFLWVTFFVSAFSDMVLAATFAAWYWTFKKKDVPYFTLTRAFTQTTFYHLGTVAFGSLILAVCRMIRIILEYIDAKLKKYDNAVTRAIMCCMRCFFWLLETFLRFLNRNAYIMCAIHGKNFCSSAKDAFDLIMRNFLRVVTLDKVTDFLFFMSKVMLTGTAGVATYYFIENNPSVIQLHYTSVPTTIVVLASFLITSVFFAVYSMAVDTLFLCFLEDCERNDGTPEKPYYMSKQLMKILGKRNKFPKRENRK